CSSSFQCTAICAFRSSNFRKKASLDLALVAPFTGDSASVFPGTFAAARFFALPFAPLFFPLFGRDLFGRDLAKASSSFRRMQDVATAHECRQSSEEYR